MVMLAVMLIHSHDHYPQAGPPTVIWHFPCLFSLLLCNLLFHNFSTPLTPPVHPLSQFMILLLILLSKPEANRRKSPLVSPSIYFFLAFVALHSTFSPIAMNALSMLLMTTSPSITIWCYPLLLKHIMIILYTSSIINSFFSLELFSTGGKHAVYSFLKTNMWTKYLFRQHFSCICLFLFLFQNLLERIGCSQCLEPLCTSMLS